jgi:hypothetical protein
MQTIQFLTFNSWNQVSHSWVLDVKVAFQKWALIYPQNLICSPTPYLSYNLPFYTVSQAVNSVISSDSLLFFATNIQSPKFWSDHFILSLLLLIYLSCHYRSYIAAIVAYLFSLLPLLAPYCPFSIHQLEWSFLGGIVLLFIST